MKHFSKKLLRNEIFSSMDPQNPPVPYLTYLMYALLSKHMI